MSSLLVCQLFLYVCDSDLSAFLVCLHSRSVRCLKPVWLPWQCPPAIPTQPLTLPPSPSSLNSCKVVVVGEGPPEGPKSPMREKLLGVRPPFSLELDEGRLERRPRSGVHSMGSSIAPCRALSGPAARFPAPFPAPQRVLVHRRRPPRRRGGGSSGGPAHPALVSTSSSRSLESKLSPEALVAAPRAAACSCTGPSVLAVLVREFERNWGLAPRRGLRRRPPCRTRAPGLPVSQCVL